MTKRRGTVSSVVVMFVTTVGAIASQQGRVVPPPTVLPARTAAISGVAVDATTDRPVPGALVVLSKQGAGPLPSDPVLTDMRGRFVFTELPAGAYSLFLVKDGYSAADTPTAVSLNDDEWFDNVRARIVPHGAITGTVIDESGEPMAGQLVRAFARLTVGGKVFLAAATAATTDDRGSYRISRLTPGPYSVAVLARNTAVNEAEAGYTYPTTFQPSERMPSDGASAEVKAGEERAGFDIQVRPVASWSVSGRIDGGVGPVAGVTLRLLPAGGDTLSRGLEISTALALADGTFTFPRVPEGAYLLETTPTLVAMETSVLPPVLPNLSLLAAMLPFSMYSRIEVPETPGFGYRMSLGSRELSYSVRGVGQSRSPGLNWARESVHVQGRDVRDIVVTLHPAATLGGSVVWEDGTPAPARPLAAVSADGDPAVGVLISSPSGTDSFQIRGLMPAHYLLRQVAARSLIMSISWNGRDYTDFPLDATDGRDISGVVVTLTERRPSVTGAVLDRRGAPATDASVIYFPIDHQLWRNVGISPPRMGSVSVDSHGRYTVNTPFGSANVPAGDYYFLAVSNPISRFWEAPSFLEAASVLATRVKANWGETTTQNLVVQEMSGAAR